MEQQQFRVSFSVGTKLLLSVATLLFALIAFLSTSAILLLTDDKQAYTFETKSTEAVLSGRDFANTTRHAFDTLRVSLANIDPTQPLTPAQKESLRSMIDNQSEIVALEIAYLDTASGKLSPISLELNSKLIEQNRIPNSTGSETPFSISDEWMKVIVPDLTKAGFGFVNISKPDGVPLLAAVLADQSLQSPEKGLPVAIGIIPLGKLASELGGLNLTIANKDGWVLFDTNPAALYSRKNLAFDPLFEASKANQLKTGTTAYEIDGAKFLGGFSKPGFDIVVLTRAEWSKAMRATYSLTEKFILLGCMSVGIGIIFAIFFSKTLTAPINRLYDATKEVGKGKFDLNLKIGSRDEIGALTSSFNVMSEKIQELFKESVEKAVLEKEIDVASTVQKTLIPPSEFDNDFVRIRSHYQAANRCGGDWWGFFSSGDKLCIGIADATGHGIPSALITAAAHSCFSMLGKIADEDPEFTFSPSAMLEYCNRVIYDSAQGSIMMTFFMGVIDLKARTITYANAAHNPPWLFKRNGDQFKINSMVSGGSRLGETRDLAELEEKTLPIAAQDILFLYTDGLIEGKALSGDMFGKKRARQLVEANLPSGPESIVRNLLDDFLKYNEGKPLDDDVTVAALVFSDKLGNA